MPKLPPPPRSPQKRSAFSVSDATTLRPSAVTTSASIRLSQVNPNLRSSQPLPLPSARPAIPVSGTRPPVTASPCSGGRGVELAPVEPALGPHRLRLRVDADALHPAQVDADPVVDHRRAGHAVPTAVDRQRDALVASQVHGCDDVVGVRAPGDEQRPPVDHAVEDGPGLVVAGVAGREQLALGSPGARRSEYRWWPWIPSRMG